jgi:hypothetical protein
MKRTRRSMGYRCDGQRRENRAGQSKSEQGMEKMSVEVFPREGHRCCHGHCVLSQSSQSLWDGLVSSASRDVSVLTSVEIIECNQLTSMSSGTSVT